MGTPPPHPQAAEAAGVGRDACAGWWGGNGSDLPIDYGMGRALQLEKIRSAVASRHIKSDAGPRTPPQNHTHASTPTPSPTPALTHATLTLTLSPDL